MVLAMEKRPKARTMSNNVQVDAYAGYKGEETPRAFIHEGIRCEVRSLLERWYTESHSYFRLIGEDGHRYVLRYDLDGLFWELVMREES
jgi:hypothetical protein